MEPVGRTARELADRLRARKTTATEILGSHVNHLAEVEHRLGAFVSTRRAAASEEAAALDRRSDLDVLPLAGVPVAVDDVLDVAGEPTRRGSSATSEEPVARDEGVIANIRTAGAVVMGKTRCPELGQWGTCDDPSALTVSPWDPTRTAGGSAGGAAAAVTAGVVPVAVGFDGHGSLRIPAAACGAFGFKPGEAILPMNNPDGSPHWFGMSRFGVIATTVADAALVLDVMAGVDRFRSFTSPPEDLKVAVSWRPPAPGVLVTASWREAAIEAGRLLRHVGHDVDHADPPYDRSMVQATIARWTQGAGADIEALGLEIDALQPRTRAQIAAGQRLARVAPVRDDDAAAWRERVSAFLEEHDVLVTPAFARSQPAATEWHTRPWAANIAANLSTYPFMGAWNLADLPSAVVPLWHDDARPLSVQIVAGAGREDLVLSVAAQLESLVPWARHAPGWGVGDGDGDGDGGDDGDDGDDGDRLG